MKFHNTTIIISFTVNINYKYWWLIKMKMKICLNDTYLKIDHETLLVQRTAGFLSISSNTSNSGINTANSIIINCIENENYQSSDVKDNRKFSEDSMGKEVLTPTIIMQGYYDIENSVNVTVDNITVIVNADYEKNNSMSILVILDGKLNESILIDLFKIVAEAKIAALWDYGVINHFSFDPLDGGDDSILIACSGSQDNNLNIEEKNNIYNLVKDCVRKAAGQALENCGFPKSVINFMEDVGVTVEDLVNAGMELLVEFENSEEINIKLHKQILKSLKDLNVVSFIISGIRLEEDYEKHRVKGVNVDDDPAYLYSDEVMGMAVANQIAGTKAIFNFKRYDEAKPGVLSTLGPVLDDIFAGLIAGCMSKIFEE